MRKLGAVLLLLAAGCGGTPPWETNVEAPPRSPDPSEDVLRHPCDFRVHDVPHRREYSLYFYSQAPEFADLRIEGFDRTKPEGEQKPYPVDPDSVEYARVVQLFFATWHALPQEEKEKYFRELHEQEKRRDETLLDQRIHYKKKAIAELEEERYLLEADLRSGVASNVAVKPARVTFLQAEVEKLARRIRIHGAQLKLLEFRRDLRNAEYAPRGMSLFTAVRLNVSDLLPYYSSPDRLVDDVRVHVRPQVWKRSLVRIEIKGGELFVRNTADVIDEVRAYLQQLHEELVGSESEPLPTPDAPPGESDIVPPQESAPEAGSGY